MFFLENIDNANHTSSENDIANQSQNLSYILRNIENHGILLFNQIKICNHQDQTFTVNKNIHKSQEDNKTVCSVWFFDFLPKITENIIANINIKFK